MTMRVTGDFGDKPSGAIKALLGKAPLLMCSSNMYNALVEELGQPEDVIRFLMSTATLANKPIGVNLPDGKGGSFSTFIAPGGWSQGRLEGYIAAHRGEVEKEYGDIDRWNTKGPEGQ